MPCCALFQQLYKIQRAVPGFIGMRLENHTLDVPEQPVGQAGGRAKLHDKLLRQIANACIAERPVGVRAIKGERYGGPSRTCQPYLCVTHKGESKNES